MQGVGDVFRTAYTMYARSMGLQVARRVNGWGLPGSSGSLLGSSTGPTVLPTAASAMSMEPIG